MCLLKTSAAVSRFMNGSFWILSLPFSEVLVSFPPTEKFPPSRDTACQAIPFETLMEGFQANTSSRLSYISLLVSVRRRRITFGIPITSALNSC